MGKRPEEELTMGAFKRYPDNEAVTMPKSVRQPPAAWAPGVDDGNVGPGGNPVRNAPKPRLRPGESSRKSTRTPRWPGRDSQNLARLRAQHGGTLNGCDEEWEKLLQRLEWSAVRAATARRNRRGAETPCRHTPFTGILSEAERNAIHEAHRS